MKKVLLLAYLFLMTNNATADRSELDDPVHAGSIYVLHLLGQSNMLGWGNKIDRSIDTTPYAAREYTPALGENVVPDPNFKLGIGSWKGLNTKLSLADNKLTGTVTVAADANINLTLTGLTVGQKYIAQAKIGGTNHKSLKFRLSAPQTQVYMTPNGSAIYLDFEFTPSDVTAMLSVFTNTIPSIGDTLTIEDISVRPVLSDAPNGSTIVASDPLTWPNSKEAPAWGVSPALQAARDLLSDGAAMVILNPLAVGGTGLYRNVWAVGGVWQNHALTQIKKAVVDYPANKAIHVLVWLQGETDVSNKVSQENYQAALLATLNSFRTISGMSNARIVILGLLPEFIARKDATAIVSAQQAVAAQLSNAVYVPTPSGYAQRDLLHFNAAGSRIIGSLIADNIP